MGEWIKVPILEVDALPDHSRALIETYCLFDEFDYFVPDYGFKVMDLVNYLNHSQEPNIFSVNEGEDFEAMKDIRSGQELLIRYEDIAENIDAY